MAPTCGSLLALDDRTLLALGTVLLKGPREALLLMSEVPLHHYYGSLLALDDGALLDGHDRHFREPRALHQPLQLLLTQRHV